MKRLNPAAGCEKPFDYLKWFMLAILTGTACGLIGTVFHHAIELATELRLTHKGLLFLLPLLGIVIAFAYEKCAMTNHAGTNGIFEAVRNGEKVPLRLAPLIFLGTVLTHLGGGSAGREGAALQMGGSLGGTIARMLRLDAKESRVLMMCGMSAVFSALFKTPLTAAVFCLEVIDVGVFQFGALFPCMVSSLMAYQVALLSNPSSAEYFVPGAVMGFSLQTALPVLILGAVAGLMSIVECEVLHAAGKLFKSRFKNPYLRIAAGGVVVVLLTLLCQTGDYNGAGMALAERSIAGEKAFAFAFLLKLLFTAITLGCGFRGGEIVPTLCIGATLGSVMGGFLGLDIGFAAAVGMIAVFCGAVNCPVSSILLSVEFFGSGSILYFALACAVSYLVSGKYSLYASQKLICSKMQLAFNDNDIA